MDYWRCQLSIGKQAISEALRGGSCFAQRLLSAQATILLFASVFPLRVEPLSGPFNVVLVSDSPPV